MSTRRTVFYRDATYQKFLKSQLTTTHMVFKLPVRLTFERFYLDRDVTQLKFALTQQAIFECAPVSLIPNGKPENLRHTLEVRQHTAAQCSTAQCSETRNGTPFSLFPHGEAQNVFHSVEVKRHTAAQCSTPRTYDEKKLQIYIYTHI